MSNSVRQWITKNIPISELNKFFDISCNHDQKSVDEGGLRMFNALEKLLEAYKDKIQGSGIDVMLIAETLIAMAREHVNKMKAEGKLSWQRPGLGSSINPYLVSI